MLSPRNYAKMRRTRVLGCTPALLCLHIRVVFPLSRRMAVPGTDHDLFIVVACTSFKIVSLGERVYSYWQVKMAQRRCCDGLNLWLRSYPDDYRRARQAALPVDLCSGPYIRLDEVLRQAEPYCRCMNPPRP
ncbi:hypothetical protein EV421DRAFT_1850052 [Armillaria borealis]|uniref:Uncharacterized protein n=1 Tax=Armillaria borealis TaxID=47425 RepID=A0AA39IYR6_9AGAR|nr:hypothetical protein EV421DRAFT_1850052 [Armillaria borealis]